MQVTRSGRLLEPHKVPVAVAGGIERHPDERGGGRACGAAVPLDPTQPLVGLPDVEQVRLGRRPVTRIAVVGFLAVLGIAARNGIMLISHCQHLEK
jgi:hypothetical protein